MGTGSRNYAYYYGVASVVYLAFSVTAFVQLQDFAGACESECPLLIRDSAARNYSACGCLPAQVGNELLDFRAYGFETLEELQAFDATANGSPERAALSQARFDKLSALQQPCFICDSDAPSSSSVFEPCSSFGICSAPSVMGFRDTPLAQLPEQCKLLKQPNATLRGTMGSVITAFAVFYLLMSLTSAIVAFGFSLYADKWADDFGRLSRGERIMGVVAKNGPMIVRLCNFLVLFFLIYSLVLVLAFEVCDTALDVNGEETLYGQVYGLVVGITIMWCFYCLFGTLFNRFVPKDTPFYAPKTPTEISDGACYRCMTATVHIGVRTGP